MKLASKRNYAKGSIYLDDSVFSLKYLSFILSESNKKTDVYSLPS